MPENPPPGYTRVAPYLLYEDPAAALDWLARAFGFRERFRHADEEGTIDHAEMELEEGLIMLAGRVAACPRQRTSGGGLGEPGGSPSYLARSPRRLGGATVVVHVYVDDIRAHCERARAAGAEIDREPSEKPYGTIQYSATDPEGHVWLFSEQVREPEPEWQLA